MTDFHVGDVVTRANGFWAHQPGKVTTINGGGWYGVRWDGAEWVNSCHADNLELVTELQEHET